MPSSEAALLLFTTWKLYIADEPYFQGIDSQGLVSAADYAHFVLTQMKSSLIESIAAFQGDLWMT